MSMTVIYQPGMQLGRTFDLKTYTSGLSIFSGESISKTTRTERHVNNIKYSVIKGSSDVNSILGVSGDISLKCKTGILEMEGMGSYLREDRSHDNTVEIIARAQVETVTESLMDDTPLAGWSKGAKGTHYIRSIIYGGDLIVRIRIKGKNSKDFSKIEATVNSDLKTSGIVDAGVHAKFQKMEDEIQNSSEVDIEYYSTTAKVEMPRDITGMLRALDNFKDEVIKLNDGRGVPCKCEILPLSMLDDKYPSVLKDSAFNAQMSTLEDKFDDVMGGKSKLDRFLMKDYQDLDLDKEDEDIATSMEQRIDDARQSLFEAISEIDVTSQKDAIPKIKDAINSYKKHTNSKLGGFLKEVNQFLKKVSGKQQSTSVPDDKNIHLEAIPEGKEISLCLLGKTGHGKSSIANSMYGENWSPVSSDADSETKECKMKFKDFITRKIHVVDTPGSMETRDPEGALEEICTAVALRPGGFDAFLITLRWNTKMTKEEVMAIKLIKKIFGEDIVMKYVIFVFTYGDTFETEQKSKENPVTFEEYIKSQKGEMAKFLYEADKRYVLFNKFASKAVSRQKMIALVKIVDEMSLRNGEAYTNKYFEKAKETWENLGWDQKKESLDSDKTKETAKKVGKTVAEEVTNDGNACFPATAMVTLENGCSVPVAEVQVGQKVMVYKTENNRTAFEDVYLFGHLDENTFTGCIQITTKSHSVTLSPDHHIFIQHGDMLKTLPAKEVEIGQSLLAIGRNGIQQEDITEVTNKVEKGLYAPFTLAGTIVVDGVLASCYVDCVPPRLAHPLMWPVRTLYSISPSLLDWVSRFRTDGIPDWIRIVHKLMEEGPDLNIVMLGKTGHGKSSTGNTILGDRRFESHGYNDTVTSRCQSASRIYEERTITILDTPDTDVDRTYMLIKEIKDFNLIFPVNALLLNLRWNTRMTSEEASIMAIIDEISSQTDLLSRTLLVFTHGDTFRPDVKARKERKDLFRNHLHQQTGVLRDLLMRVGNRYLLVNNMEMTPRRIAREASEIVGAIDALIINEQTLYEDDIAEEEKHASWWEVLISGCFPASSRVVLEDNEVVEMSMVQIGQKVLTRSACRKLEYSEVYLFGHFNGSAVTDFITIKTENNRLKVSPDHHIFINQDDIHLTIPAWRVQKGMHVLVMKDGGLEKNAVIDVARSQDKGLYAPFTLSGTIVVDGVLASCYVDCVPPRLAHPLMWPVRTLYSISPSLLDWVSRSRTDGIPDWIKLLMGFALRVNQWSLKY